MWSFDFGFVSGEWDKGGFLGVLGVMGVVVFSVEIVLRCEVLGLELLGC